MYCSNENLVVNPETLMNMALEFRDRFGWTSIPLSAERFPLSEWKQYQENKPSKKEMQSLFSCDKQLAGVGVLGGTASNDLVIRDYDQSDAYLKWATEHKDLSPLLPTVKTSRGYHVYFRGPSFYDIYEDGEYRGLNNHYTVVPPSYHPDGCFYRWLKKPTEEIPWVKNPLFAGLLGISKKPLKLAKSSIQPTYLTLNTIGVNPYLAGSKLANKRFLREYSELVETCIPSGPGERNAAILDLVRKIKGIKVDWTKEELFAFLWYWWKRAKRFVRTQNEFISHRDFFFAYERWQPEKKFFVPDAFVFSPPSLIADYSDLAKQIVRACCYLQSVSNDNIFYLASQALADWLKCSRPMVSIVLKKMQRDGLLKLVQRGNSFSHLASTYRYFEATE